MQRFILLILLVVFCATSITASAAFASPNTLPSTAAGAYPGAELAKSLSEITGVAISPLLGISVVGAWQYYRATPVERAHLPWFAEPPVWIMGFILLGFCFLKDVLGTASPAVLKKPLDAAELFENKVSGLIACGAVVPFLAAQWSAHAPVAALAEHLHLASIFSLATVDLRFLTIPLAMIGFTVVWLACHAINVLIILCPIGAVDAVLKLVKASLLLVVAGSAWLSPYLGAAVSGAIILAAWFIAPWAFRLTTFGTLFALDVLLPGRGRARSHPTAPHAFLGQAVSGVPVRTYGQLVREEQGSLSFTYRPWLVLPRRQLLLPPGQLTLAKGLVYPSLEHCSGAGTGRPCTMLMFLPRYRGQEAALAEHFSIVDVREHALAKGFQAARAWVREVMSFRPAALPGQPAPSR